MLALALPLAACSAAGEEPGVAATHDLDASTLIADIADYAEPLAKEWQVPSIAVGIVTRDGLAAQWYYGENTAGEPVDGETLFEIGSATKAFLGVSEALLVERGDLDWKDPVVDHYPEFQLHDPWVTREMRIEDLLAQRTGMAPYAGETLGFLGYPYQSVIDSLRYFEPVSSFRSEFAYQNIPHLVAGNIVANYENTDTWGDAAEQLIFGPLGMDSTSVAEDALTSAGNATLGHQMRDGAPLGIVSGRFPTEAQGAGGIVSNIEDMSKWVAMHLSRGNTEDGRFISEELLEDTYRPRVPVTGEFANGMKQGDGEPHIGYATGWLVHSTPEGRIIEHGGTTNGYNSSVRMDPDRGIGIVVLTNLLHQGGLAGPIGKYAMDLIQQREPADYAGQVEAILKEREAATSDAPDPAPVADKDLEPFKGRYTHPFAGDIEVQAEGGALVTEIGPRNTRVVFDPISVSGGEGEFGLTWYYGNDPESWLFTERAVFSGEGAEQRLRIAELEFVAT